MRERRRSQGRRRAQLYQSQELEDSLAFLCFQGLTCAFVLSDSRP